MRHSNVCGAIACAGIFLWTSLCAAPAPAGDDSASTAGSARVEWASSLEEALKQAASNQQPVFVALVSESVPAGDGSPGRASAVFASYRDPRVAAASRRFVCVAACPDRHADDGAACDVFPGVRCQDHRTAAERIRERYLAGAEPEWPEHWILDSDGRLVSRFCGDLTAAELADTLRTAADRLESAVAGAITKALGSRRVSDRTAGFRLALSFLSTHPARMDVRRAAARYLGRIKRDPERVKAWREIERTATEAALDLLVPWLSVGSPDLRTRTIAVFAAAEPQRPLLPALIARVRKEREVTALVELVRALTHYTTVDPKAYAALTRLIGHRNESVRVAATLAAASPDNRAVRDELLRRARREANPRARAAAIFGLARMGEVDALPTLRRARRGERRGGTIGDALDLAIRSLEGDAGAARALGEAVDRLLAESGAGESAIPEARDRTDRNWRDMGRGR